MYRLIVGAADDELWALGKKPHFEVRQGGPKQGHDFTGPAWNPKHVQRRFEQHHLGGRGGRRRQVHGPNGPDTNG